MSTAATAKPSSAGYDVARPHGRCAVTERVIEPGEKFMAALRETNAGFERVDVSADAWDRFDRKDVLAYWQAVMPRGETKKRLFVDDTVLCELFERLADATEPAKINFRFVLGLILMRKRLVVCDSRRSETDREVWSVRIKGRQDALDLVNPNLAEQQILEVSQQLSQVLSEEL